MYNTTISWDFANRHRDADGNITLLSGKVFFDYLSSEFKRQPIEDKALTLARLVYFGFDLPAYIVNYQKLHSDYILSSLADTLLCYIQTLRWGEAIHITTEAMQDNMSANELATLLQEELRARYTIWEGIGEDKLIFSRWRDDMLEDMIILSGRNREKIIKILTSADFSREYKDDIRVPKEKLNFKNNKIMTEEEVKAQNPWVEVAEKNQECMKLTINELLETRGITEKDGVKFLRHKFSKDKTVTYYNAKLGEEAKLEDFVTIEDFYRNCHEDFMMYQNTQLTSNFKGVNYIVSFIAESGKRARFIGVYKLDGEPIQLADTPSGKSRSFYNFIATDILQDLKERIIIDWGESTITWHQKLSNKKEILMIGDPLGDLPFPGYMDFTLSRQELERVFEFKYKEWKNALTAVNCIYLITDNNSGKHYVGSTYNTDGIWGRWKCYAETIHGNNKDLIKLINSQDDKYKNKFQYTILQILPLNITPKEAIDREEVYKKKLGSKAHGLNN